MSSPFEYIPMEKREDRGKLSLHLDSPFYKKVEEVLLNMPTDKFFSLKELRKEFEKKFGNDGIRTTLGID